MRLSSFLYRGLVFPAILLAGTAVARADTSSAYTFSTLSGIPILGSTDGPATGAHFNRISAVAVDSKGNTFVADTSNSTIRMLSPGGVVSTFAGLAGAIGSMDGTGTAARFYNPAGLAIDPLNDTLYVSDTGNHTIRSISPAGVVSTLAGSAGSVGFADAVGTAAGFDLPFGLAVDKAHNVYVADTGNNIIRMINPQSRNVTTVAGAGMIPSTGSTDATGTAATNARFNTPHKAVVDNSGNIYVADSNNHTIRKISPVAGGLYTVSTLAGSPGVRGSTDGNGSAAHFDYPSGIALDSAGNVYVADMLNNAIRQVTPSGQVSTVAGASGLGGSVDGIGISARFSRPSSVALDASGNIYVADSYNHTIRKIAASDSTVTTIAGVAGVRGIADGTGTAALFNYPAAVAVDSAGNIYEAEASSNTIRKITPAAVVTTVAGLAGAAGWVDDLASAARFDSPQDVSVDSAGNVYIADTDNCTIRKMTPAGVVTTIGGTPRLKGHKDGVGILAQLSFPSGVSVDSHGNVFVADTSNNTIRKIAPDTTVTTIAGMASNAGYADGAASTAQFYNPAGIAVDSLSNLYVADTGNNTIRRIANGMVSVYAGAGFTGSSGSTDGSARAARFSSPNGVAIDSTGNLYVADTDNDTIRLIAAADQTVSTLAGAALSPGTLDGAGVTARFYNPAGIAVDGSANVYVADTGNNTIRKITPAGIVSTLAGLLNNRGSDDGSGSAARFSDPNGIVVASDGNVYVADTFNQTIRKITPTQPGVVTTFAGQAGLVGALDTGTGIAATFSNPLGITADGIGNLFVADSTNSTIRKITADGTVTTLAGLAGTTGSTDGTGTSALFFSPAGIAANTAGDTVYVADSANNTIRQVKIPSGGSANLGVVTTIAGLAGTSGNTDGTGTAALFYAPQGIALANDGTIYVADTANETIRKVTAVGVVSTLAGTAGVRGHVDGAGTATQFNAPFGVAVDTAGNVYVADGYNYVIRKITAGGVVSTLAGLAGSPGHADGFGSDARFAMPHNLTLDASNNLYVSDTANNIIRKVVTATGQVTTVAGLAPEGSIGNADGSAADARYNEPGSVAIDSDGNLYVADTLNATVRKIANGKVTTLAGVVGVSGSADGTGSAAQFWFPYGVAVQGHGSSAMIYVADAYNGIIRRIAAADGYTMTFAGMAGSRGSTDGTGSDASFYKPTAVAVDNASNVYVADSVTNTIRKITPDRAVTTFAGLAGTSGYVDAAGSGARFTAPSGVAVDSAGNVYVADTGTNTVRKITPAGVVTTLAGSPTDSGSTDGTGTNARFNGPTGVSVDAAGNIFVTDSFNQMIRKVTQAGVVTTLGGTANLVGSTDGTGSAALFNYPSGVTVDTAGNLYVADTLNNTIRMGVPSPGSGGSGGPGGPGGGSNGSGSSGGTGGITLNPSSPGSLNSQAAGQSLVLFLFPTSVARDSSGNLYVADAANNTIQKITSSGVVATLAGMGGTVGTTDATGSFAMFNQPNGVTVDGSGNVFVADTGNGTIRKITSSGVVTTLAGSTSSRGNRDGTGTGAWFSSPTGIASDSSGNLYVADAFTNTIRKVTPAGVVSTIAGSAAVRGGAVDATGTAARFSYPTGVAVDGSGNLYIADAYNDTVRKITPDGTVATLAGLAQVPNTTDATGINARFNQPIGVAVDGSGNVFVADTANCTIRKITASGAVTTVAGTVSGSAGVAGFADGTTTTLTLFNQPRGLVPDGSGGLYVADSGNAAIRKIAVGGTVSTPAMTQGYIDTTGTTIAGPPPAASTSTSGGGGGGAIEPRFLALLALLGISRWLTRKK